MRPPLGRYVLRRVLYALPTLLGVTLAVFLLVRLIPGDPGRIIAGLLASDEDVQRLRIELGLDRPLPEQYVRFLASVLSGDFGLSAVTRTPVIVEIGIRMRATMMLAVTSTALAVAAGVSAGVLAAAYHNTAVDYSVMMVALGGVSVPVFWLGIMLMLLFAVHLHWLPAGGIGTPAHLVLPALTLAAFSTAIVARMTRGSLLETLGLDFVRTARAKGMGKWAVIIHHALRNALIPVVTVVGLQFGTLLGGAVLTETTFAWPGLGRLLVSAITARDYPVIQGIVIIFAAMFVVVNLVTDLLYVTIDPRIRYE